MNDPLKIAVFIRAANDLDHIVPVMHKFIERNPHAQVEIMIVDYFCTHEDDFRLRHLQSRGVRVTHAADYMEWPPVVRRLYFKAAGSAFLPLSLAARAWLRLFAGKKTGTSWFADRFFADEKFQNLDAIITDHTMPVYKKILQKAAEKNIATLGLPHAADNFENWMIDDGQLNPYGKTRVGEPFLFDRVIVTSTHMCDAMLKGGRIEEDRIHICGSARFCEEWQAILRQIAPQGAGLPAGNDFKIVVMLPKRDKNSFEAEILRIIKTISRIENTVIAVKLDTRAEAFGRVKAKNVIFCGREVASKTLIDWADLTLFTATSVIADNIREDKPVLHLRRTMGNKIVFERYISSWAIDCRDDLCETIMRLQSGEQTRTYTEEERDNLLAALIEPAGKDVLNLYVDEILAAIKTRATA